MTQVSQILHQLANPELTHVERARLRCVIAGGLEQAGNYGGAREVMAEVWPLADARPVLDGLDEFTAADVLLRAGALTGWIGSDKQIEGSQVLSKDLISESISRFESLDHTDKAAEAQTELAVCYWREGAFDEARVLLSEALGRLSGERTDVKALAALRSALVESASNRYNEAFRILTEAIPLIEESKSNVLKGKFHNEFALVLMFLSTAEHRDDYRDRALIEYTASSYYFEQAGHGRYQACVENNLGFLFSTIGKFEQAHEHLDRAQALLAGLRDSVHLAQVGETRARVYLAEGRAAEAEKFAGTAVHALERGGEQSLLAEALTTHGVALARSGRVEQAEAALRRAAAVAEEAGDSEGAGQAALTLVEELGERLGRLELLETFERADELLLESGHQGHRGRLLGCARRVLCAFGARSGAEEVAVSVDMK